MKRFNIMTPAVLFAAVLSVQTLSAQEMSTPPATEGEKEDLYTVAIEGRAADIIKNLNLTDAARSAAVHDLIIAQYRIMRARDALIDAQLRAMGKEVNYENRAAKLQAESKVLHDHFFAKLAEVLTPEQVEMVKDRMTYNKVKVTYDAYCQIIPALTDTDKAKVLELLKAAREEAVDGGSAGEKTAIFAKYKNQIKDYLVAHGHDVDQAFKDWNAKHADAVSAAH